MNRSVAITALLLCRVTLSAAERSPLFQIGKPGIQSFATYVSGYGALGEDQSHVAVYVPPAASQGVHPGSAAEVRLDVPGSLSVVVPGRVTSVLPEADPRTGQAIVSIAIPVQSMPPRTYASASIELSVRRALAVPTTAVLIQDGQACVYREEEPGDFTQVVVQTGEQRPDITEIKSGLTENDSILIQGALEWSRKGAIQEPD